MTGERYVQLAASLPGVVVASAPTSIAGRPETARIVPLEEVPIGNVVIDDAFRPPRIEVWRTVAMPDCFDKFERERGDAFENFDRDRDGKAGRHVGPAWYDGFTCEMIRASASDPDGRLKCRCSPAGPPASSNGGWRGRRGDGVPVPRKGASR